MDTGIVDFQRNAVPPMTVDAVVVVVVVEVAVLLVVVVFSSEVMRPATGYLFVPLMAWNDAGEEAWENLLPVADLV